MERPLEGTVVVVVGGTSGIGASAVRAFVAHGARVVAFGRDDDHLAHAAASLGDAGRVFAGDARESASAERAIKIAQDEFGGFDALYHVAGGSGRSLGDGPLHTIPDEGWDATLDLNLRSVFLSNRAAVRAFLRSGARGAILNVGSALAESPAPRYFGTHAYAAAKSALVGLTRSCAATYAKDGIRFNVLAPALVDTPMSRRAMDDPAIQAYVRSKQPLQGRAALPSDLDAAAVYLLSPAAASVTGQVLAVDGGWSVSEGEVA